METFEGKTAFITGGAGGIGLAVAGSLGRRGANIMLADISQEKLGEAVATLAGDGIVADMVVCDVADAASMEDAARRTVERFGKVHIVINNAGVSLIGPPGEIPLEDWRWIVDTNLMGVIHGVEVFLPLLRAHGEGGHIVNTASIAGHWAVAGSGPYSATKFAVVGYTEALRQDLASQDIGVSLLCPGWVRTRLQEARLRRPSHVAAGPDAEDMPNEATRMADEAIASGIDPALVGEWVADCMAARRFYIFTHPEMAPIINRRAIAMKIDYAACIDDPRFAAKDD